MKLFERKIRGFRLVDVVALSLLISLMFGVYLAKTLAGRERSEIAAIERQIKNERQRVRLLQAEVAHLEKPERIGQLSSTYLGMGPSNATRETTAEAIGQRPVEVEAPKPEDAP
jgi:cell division protein FtsL